MDATTLNAHLEKHLRVSTFPLGIRPLLHGLLLWAIIGSASLVAVLAGVLR